MKLNEKILLSISLLLLPIIAFANGNGTNNFMGFLGTIGFISIHSSIFLLSPLSKIISQDNHKKAFWILFIVRIAVLLILYSIIGLGTIVIDFISVFVGGFIVVPISLAVDSKRKRNLAALAKETAATIKANVNLNCAKCGAPITVNDTFCKQCGNKIEGNNITVSEAKPKTRVLPSAFDTIYSLSEDKMLEEVIKKEMVKAGFNPNEKLIPADILKRKKILNIIFSILVFILVSMIFFHFPTITYILGIILLLVYFIVTRKYDLNDYLIKEIKSRPQEKISNIIMNIKNSSSVDSSKKVILVSLLVALVLPLIIFMKPRIIYEKVDGGYGVRYYIYGVTNFTTAVIPEMHNGEKVISLRGNAFSNMSRLEKVELSDNIKEIRGQAFLNCRNLKRVKMSKNLEYLGGGAFRNATSIEEIVLPNTLTYLGGEAFYGASSLISIELPNGLDEIRGDTFKNCTSLKNITIPSSVKRIGGDAFAGSAITNIELPSGLEEIGGGAFKDCKSLTSIEIPDSVTRIGGEAFYGASSLETVKLPHDLDEIHGDTFEYCTSLKSIEIPDSVTRIGGHAFYEDSNLSEVKIGPNSKLIEIGSSAFRKCNRLLKITIPKDTYVNERAFKESPTVVHRYGE